DPVRLNIGVHQVSGLRDERHSFDGKRLKPALKCLDWTSAKNTCVERFNASHGGGGARHSVEASLGDRRNSATAIAPKQLFISCLSPGRQDRFQQPSPAARWECPVAAQRLARQPRRQNAW